MQRITIGRYGVIPSDIPRQDGVVPAQDDYDGWIEGVRDDGTGWILFLNKDGSPETFWSRRDEAGGVEGDPVYLPVG